jgi:spore coat protein JB
MDNAQRDLLLQIMETSFVLVETGLFLDTHPYDENAIRTHNNASQTYEELVNIYELRYGPLTYTGMSRSPWNYIDGPWPWEINFSEY